VIENYSYEPKIISIENFGGTIMAKLKCRECGNVYTAYTEMGLWPICPACKRAKEDQKEQKKQTALQHELLENQLEATRAEERRQREADDRQRRHEEELIRIEKEKAEREIQIAQKKESERKSQEAKKRITEIADKILSENQNMLLVGFSFQNHNQFEKNELINKKDSEGFYLDIEEIASSNIVLDKIDLVGFKKVSDNWENYTKFDNGKYIYYFSKTNNDIEKIIFLKKTEISNFEKIISDIDNNIIKKESDRKKAEQAERERQAKINEINNVISTAMRLNAESAFNTNKKLLVLFKFSEAIQKPLKDYKYFIEILDNQKSKPKILKFIQQNEEMLSILSSLDIKYEKFTKELLLFENTLFGKAKKFENIMNNNGFNNEQLLSYITKFDHLNNFIPKTKKFIYSTILNQSPGNLNFKQNINNAEIQQKKVASKSIEPYNEKLTENINKQTGIEYVDLILNSSKLVIISVAISLISSLFFIAGLASFNFVPFGFIGHVITIPIIIYARFKHKIKIWPIMVIFAISFIIAVVSTPTDKNNVDSKSNTKIEKRK